MRDEVERLTGLRPSDGRRRQRCGRGRHEQLLELQADYQQWLDGLLESLADTPTADALRTVCELDVEALDVDSPRGFGRN